MKNADEITVEEIETFYNSLIHRIASCEKDKMVINAELSSYKRELKETMEEIKKAGFDPNNLKEEIKKRKEVLITKMQIISADLDQAESILRPMLSSIERD